MSKNKGNAPATPSAEKAARDNRANQLNPNNPTYQSSRQQPPSAPKSSAPKLVSRGNGHRK